MSASTVKPRFDDALEATLAWARRNAVALGSDTYILRDVYGRIRMLPGGSAPVPPALVEELYGLLGAYSPGTPGLMLDRAFFAPEKLVADRTPLGDGIFLVDRLVSEQGWRRASVATPGHCRRVIFFSMKGGVGRTTALVAVAMRLMERGERVLVVDLDLESPGATSMLLRPGDLPAFGAVDWLVEDAVGQGDDDLLHAMVATSRVDKVLVTPALGQRSVPDNKNPSLRDGAFVAKLGRAYASSSDGAEFAQRLERLVSGLERVHQPTVVLVDSRAGMHDISAATVPRLGGTVLLFAGMTSQTWFGYRLLFSAWRGQCDTTAHFRERARVVAGLVPETNRLDYLSRLRRAAHSVFSDYVNNETSFNDKSGPHWALPIYWRREFLEWEPAGGPGTQAVTQPQFEAAFSDFLEGVVALPGVLDVAQLPSANPKGGPLQSDEADPGPDMPGVQEIAPKRKSQGRAPARRRSRSGS